MFGHVRAVLLSPRTGRCVCVCVTCCTYRNGVTPDMHTTYSLFLCVSFCPSDLRNMSAFVLRWISLLQTLDSEDFARLHEAVLREHQEREHRMQHDQILFRKFKARCRGNQTDQESSGDDSPGEFEPHVVATLENMCQSFEVQATRLRLELLRFALIRLRMRRTRPAFKRSLQFSDNAISVD